MSHRHTDVVADLENVPTSYKAVLWQLAHHACQNCGLCWPGIGLLARKSGLSENATRQAISWLVKESHLEVFWQARGGRGFTSEYLVVPSLVQLLGAPCSKCVSNKKPHPNGKPRRLIR